jgi:Zn-dependent protease
LSLHATKVNREAIVNGTIPLGRFAGVPVRAHPSALIMVVGFTVMLAVDTLPSLTVASTPAYWLTAGIFGVLFTGSLLAHEFAHAALARRLGIPVESVTLWMFGGATALGYDPPTPGKAAGIAGIGPVVNGGLGVVSYVLAAGLGPDWLSGLPTAGLLVLTVFNLLMAVLNLLPGAPLDGGRLLQAWLWHRSGDRARATATTAVIGQGLGGGLIGFGTVLLVNQNILDGFWLLMLGSFILAAASAERAAPPRARVPDVPVGQVMTVNPIIAPAWWTVEEFIGHLIRHGFPYRLFPVRDEQGAPVGMVTRGDLFGIEPSLRRTVHVRDVTHPLDSRFLARPDEPLAAVIRRTPLRPAQDTVIVIDDRGPIGILTATDVRRTSTRAA